MIGLTGAFSLAMSGTNSTLVRVVNPPRLQNVTWSAVTCSKLIQNEIFDTFTQYSTAQHSIARRGAVRTPHSAQHSTAQYSTAQHSIARRGAAQREHRTAQYSTVQHCTTQHNRVQITRTIGKLNAHRNLN